MSTPIPRRTALRSAAAAAVGVAAAGALAACTGSGSGSGVRGTPGSSGADTGDPGQPPTHTVTPARDTAAAAVDPHTAGASAASLAASRALLESASIVVVTSGQPADIASGTDVARRLGIPLLVQGPKVAAELDRLGVRTVIRVSGDAAASPAPDASPGASATPAAPAPVPTAFGDREVLDGSDDLGDLPGLPLTPPSGGGTVLVRKGARVPASAAATLAAVGATQVPVTSSDPRVDTGAGDALRKVATTPVLAVGAGFGPAERLAQRVRTTRHAPELPGGGLLPFPGRQMVALYGHPQTAALGMLGEQSSQEAASRVRAVADEYQRLTSTTVVPAFELIATVATGSPGKDGTYSRSTPVDVLLPWVKAAEASDTYVVLDLQSGREDFLTQAKAYEELLRRPWVGLALDPEWRLGPQEKPLQQIGHVGIDEVNEVGAWLAALVREHDLPPKVLTLHQFRPSMVRDRDKLDTSLDEVQWLVHADGQGGQGAKQGTWSALKRDLPDGVWLGWKNFEDEDTPMLTPEQTMAQVHPTPSFVSYQ